MIAKYQHILFPILFFVIGLIAATQLLGSEVCDYAHRDGTAIRAQSCSSPTIQTARGPGTEMTQIINRLGLGSNCGRCKALAAEMDRGGPDWVSQNRQYVVQRTISNAKNLGHRMGPAQRMGVRMIVRTAVRRSR